MSYSLPAKTLEAIADKIDEIDDLRNFRLASRTCNEIGAKKLARFSFLLDETPESQERLARAAEDTVNCNFILEIKILIPHTFWKFFIPEALEEDEPDDRQHPTYTRYIRLEQFILDWVPFLPGLKYLTVHWVEPLEKPKPSELAKLRTVETNGHRPGVFLPHILHFYLERLSIRGMPTDCEFSLPEGPHFYDIQILKITRCNSVLPFSGRLRAPGPRNFITFPLITTRLDFLDIRLQWYSLRHLSLGSWGMYQKLSAYWDEDEVHSPYFRQLESIELRGFGFNRDNDLESFFFSNKSLRSIKLVDCTIVHAFVSDHLTNLDDNQRWAQTYKMRWARFFKRCEDELPLLENFQIGSNRVRKASESIPPFESEQTPTVPPWDPKFIFGLFEDRYLEMTELWDQLTLENRGVFRMSWIGNEIKDQPDMSDEDPRDMKSLRSLLEKIGQEFQETGRLSQVVHVKKGFGHVQKDTRTKRHRTTAARKAEPKNLERW